MFVCLVFVKQYHFHPLKNEVIFVALLVKRESSRFAKRLGFFQEFRSEGAPQNVRSPSYLNETRSSFTVMKTLVGCVTCKWINYNTSMVVSGSPKRW